MMRYHRVQKRTQQTVAVVRAFCPALQVGGTGADAWHEAAEALTALAQAVETKTEELRLAEKALREATRGVDRKNKRVYRVLRAEARFDPRMSEALGQIETQNPRPMRREPGPRPPTRRLPGAREMK